MAGACREQLSVRFAYTGSRWYLVDWDRACPDPARVRWITQMENILTQSYTEQGAYDFKQGFLRLDGKNTFDDVSFDKILRP